MNKTLLLATSLLAVLVGCASVKDENGKTVGTCIGAGCVLRAAFGANTVDSKTGLMPGEIPLFSVGGASAPASAPVAAAPIAAQ